MKRYVPTVNCGLLAGMTPEVYDGEIFKTEEECEEWISENEYYFSNDELAGGVYPFEIEEE